MCCIRRAWGWDAASRENTGVEKQEKRVKKRKRVGVVWRKREKKKKSEGAEKGNDRVNRGGEDEGFR